NVDYGINILINSNFRDGTNGWFPLGNYGLGVVKNGLTHLVHHAARNTLSGHCIHATNRSHTWMAPTQIITDKVKLFVTYQVLAWVRLGSSGCGPQNVNVAIGVDDQWVSGGQIEINDDMWQEIYRSFRIEKQPGKVMVYIQGPSLGINFMVVGFRIFAVDRRLRFEQLKEQTD
ncbi:carbohydrate-binding, CenC-like protein, partial [Tanacetum coccineum]